MTETFPWEIAANHRTQNPKRYNISTVKDGMACFCGCETYQKNDDGFKIACVKCGHGPQNHEEEFRAAARKNTEGSQKRDSDFG